MLDTFKTKPRNKELANEHYFFSSEQTLCMLPEMICDLCHDSFNGASVANISTGCSQSNLDTICVHEVV